MSFGNMRGMGSWGVAFAASLALHVVVLGGMALLGMRGCGSETPVPPPPTPQTDGRAQDLPPRTDVGQAAQSAAGDVTSSATDVKSERIPQPEKMKSQDGRKTAKPEKVKTESRKTTVTKVEKSETDSVKEGWKSYKVRPGDSLTKIARACGCTVQELAKANGLAPTASLKFGQVIKVKGALADEE